MLQKFFLFLSRPWPQKLPQVSSFDLFKISSLPNLFYLVGKKKALIASKAVAKGVNTKSKKNIRTSVHFYRPKTLVLSRKPKYARKSTVGDSGLDHFQILRYPLTTESAMKKIEDQNTLVFIVDIRANKYQIKDAVKKLYQIKAAKVNTLIRYLFTIIFPIIFIFY